MRLLHLPTTQTRLRPFKPIQFGRYTLLMPLASGGMGEIFLARLEGVQGFEKLCVIKKILPHLTQEEDFVTRFVNEAKTLVQLQHGSIGQVLDMGLHDGEPYLALEFVDGKDLRKVAARSRERNLPLPLTFVLYTMGRVLDALAYAHRKRDGEEKEIGLVHRDVSPQNILISYEGEVKVIDFGLAKSTLNVARTNPSIVLGKFLYMSPEQARHQKIDRRSDLYAVGLCLYELVAGKNPFDDVPPGELMAKVASPQIAHIQQVEPLCPGSVAQTLMKSLAIDPAGRYQTAEEFRGRLMAVLLEIDPSAGPESCSRFMRDAFAAEYSSERKLLASLREQRLSAPLQMPMPVKEPEPLGGSKKEISTAVRNLSDIAKRSMERQLGEELTPMPTDPSQLGKRDPLEWTPDLTPLPGLSFAPTPRLKGDDGRASQTDRETMPSINLASVPGSSPLTDLEPITSRATAVVVPDEAPRPAEPLILGELITGTAPVLKPVSPWSANETTTPAGPAFDASLPAVMTSEPSETYEPGRAPVSIERPRPVLPFRPVVAPLPAALKNKSPPASESTGKTIAPRSGLVWILIPLLAMLAVAAYLVHDSWDEQIRPLFVDPPADDRSRLGPPSLEDRRYREVPADLSTAPPSEPEKATVDEPPPPAAPEVVPQVASDPELIDTLIKTPAKVEPAPSKPPPPNKTKRRR